MYLPKTGTSFDLFRVSEIASFAVWQYDPLPFAVFSWHFMCLSSRWSNLLWNLVEDSERVAWALALLKFFPRALRRCWCLTNPRKATEDITAYIPLGPDAPRTLTSLMQAVIKMFPCPSRWLLDSGVAFNRRQNSFLLVCLSCCYPNAGYTDISDRVIKSHESDDCISYELYIWIQLLRWRIFQSRKDKQNSDFIFSWRKNYEVHGKSWLKQSHSAFDEKNASPFCSMPVTQSLNCTN